MGPWLAVKSLFGIHNETGNIFTHLFGFFLFAALTLYMMRSPPTPLAMGQGQVESMWESVRTQALPSLQERLHKVQAGLSIQVHRLQDELSREGHAIHHAYQEAMAQLKKDLIQWPNERWPMLVFMAGAMTCLLFSSICHLLGCCQKHVALYIWRLDYAGIGILIVASFYPVIYYGLLCQPLFRAFYLISSTFFGVLVIAVSLLDIFQSREWRSFRYYIFASLGFYGFAPIFHVLFFNYDVHQVKVAMALATCQGLVYLGGGGIYASRVPERWFPGRFDLFFNSHQIWHVCVVLAALIHWRACMMLLEWRDASGGCAAPITSPLSTLQTQMRDLGHDLFSVDEVWARLSHYVHEHLHSQVNETRLQ
jgi:adiponectin receptor